MGGITGKRERHTLTYDAVECVGAEDDVVHVYVTGLEELDWQPW